LLNQSSINFFKRAVGLSNLGRESDIDISARCPYCNDKKSRLHLYNKGGSDFVHCWNAGCTLDSVHNIYGFLKECEPDLLQQYKKETFKSKIDSLKTLKDIVQESNESQESKDLKPSTEDLSSFDLTLDFLDTLSDTPIAKQEDLNVKPVKPVITQDLSGYFSELTEQADAYIVKRIPKLYKNIKDNNTFGKWYFGIQDLKIGETTYNITNNIIIPLYYNDEMYGFYSRSISGKKFVTYMDENNIGYKIWNFFNVNLDEPVYIFEGIFDAISSGETNVIALLGAKLPKDRLKDIKQPVFCLDNDKTGHYTAIQYAKQGYHVYVQPAKYKEKDMNDLSLNHPELDIADLIKKNTFKGISAITRIKIKI